MLYNISMVQYVLVDLISMDLEVLKALLFYRVQTLRLWILVNLLIAANKKGIFGFHNNCCNDEGDNESCQFKSGMPRMHFNQPSS